MNSDKKTARLAGLFYLLIAVVAPYGLIYVPGKVIVSGDPVATANNILAHEMLFRSGVAASMIGHVLFIVLVLLLYKLLKDVGEHLARLMVVLVVVGVPIASLADVSNITALMILKGNVIEFVESASGQDMVAMLIKFGSYSIQMVQLFWGLWLLPFGLLVYRSRFIPRVLGVLLVINGIAYILLSLVFTLFPESHSIVLKFTRPFLFGEIVMMLWLLIKGINVKKPEYNTIL